MRDRSRRRLLAGIAGVAAALLLVAILAGLVAAAGASRSNGRTLDAVLDCTTPGRTCHTRGVQQTREAVGTINEVSIAAAACAAQIDHPTAAEVRRCVVRALDADEKGTTP